MLDQFADYELRVRLLGASSISVPAGQTVSSSFAIDGKLIVTGAEYFRSGNVEDTVSLNIKLNGEVIATIASDIFMSDEGRYEFYKAVLNTGNALEVIYKNNGQSSATFRWNVIAHVEKA